MIYRVCLKQGLSRNWFINELRTSWKKCNLILSSTMPTSHLQQWTLLDFVTATVLWSALSRNLITKLRENSEDWLLLKGRKKKSTNSDKNKLLGKKLVTAIFSSTFSSKKPRRKKGSSKNNTGMKLRRSFYSSTRNRLLWAHSTTKNAASSRCRTRKVVTKENTSGVVRTSIKPWSWTSRRTRVWPSTSTSSRENKAYSKLRTWKTGTTYIIKPILERSGTLTSVQWLRSIRKYIRLS